MKINFESGLKCIECVRANTVDYIKVEYIKYNNTTSRFTYTLLAKSNKTLRIFKFFVIVLYLLAFVSFIIAIIRIWNGVQCFNYVDRMIWNCWSFIKVAKGNDRKRARKWKVTHNNNINNNGGKKKWNQTNEQSNTRKKFDKIHVKQSISFST